MKELIGKLEEATEGSRELDAEICWLVKGDPNLVAYLHHYTTSLDAALTLVPEGYDRLVGTVDGNSTAEVGPTGTFQTIEVFAKTEPLALCIAALRAREKA